MRLQPGKKCSIAATVGDDHTGANACQRVERSLEQIGFSRRARPGHRRDRHIRGVHRHETVQRPFLPPVMGRILELAFTTREAYSVNNYWPGGSACDHDGDPTSGGE